MNTVVKSRLIKIITIILFTLLCTSSTYAASLGDMIGGADDFITDGEAQGDAIQPGDLQKLSDTVYNIVFVIGIVIAMIMGLVLGIKFMTGSVEEKSKIKEALTPYIVGCIIIFGAFGIWKLVITVLRGI